MEPGKNGTTLENEILTVQEVAEYLRVSRVTVWRWCKQGVLPASRVGRNWRIRRQDLLEMLDTGQGYLADDLSQDSDSYKEDLTLNLPKLAAEKEFVH